MCVCRSECSRPGVKGEAMLDLLGDPVLGDMKWLRVSGVFVGELLGFAVLEEAGARKGLSLLAVSLLTASASSSARDALSNQLDGLAARLPRAGWAAMACVRCQREQGGRRQQRAVNGSTANYGRI